MRDKFSTQRGLLLRKPRFMYPFQSVENTGYIVSSNRESGEGRPDIILLDRKAGTAAVFELKRSETLEGMEAVAEDAISQLRDREYGNETVAKKAAVFCCLSTVA